MEQGPHAFGAEPREENRGRHRDGEHGNQRPGNLPHKDQRADDGVDARHHLHQVLRKRRVDGVDVIGNAADDVAGGVCVEIADRQRGELFKKLLPHRVDDALAEPDHQDGQQIGQDGRSGVADQHPADVFPNRVEVNAAFGRDGVDGVARILRTHQRELVGGERQQNGQQKQRPVLQNVAAEPEHKPLPRPAIELFYGSRRRGSVGAYVARRSALIQREHLPSANR